MSARDPRPARSASPALAFAVAAAPAAWVLHLYASYALVTVACRAGAGWTLVALWLGALALAGGGAATGAAAWRRGREGGGWPAFLALGSLAGSGFFLLLIGAAGLPLLLQGVCT